MQPMTPKPTQPLPGPAMPTNPIPAPPKPAVKSRGMWGGLVLVVGFLAMLGGVDIDLAFLSDGWQVVDLKETITVIGVLAGLVLSILGRKNATQPVRGVLSSE